MLRTHISLMEDMGLSRISHKPYEKKKLIIDKGEVDPKSYGAIAMVSSGEFDEEGILKSFSLRYWAIHPDGRYEIQHLFELEIKSEGKRTVRISGLSVLGRQVALDDTKAIDNAIEAIRRIHINLRDREPELPDVSAILRDCRIEDIIGEKLQLPGFHLRSRLYFPVTTSFNIASNNNGRPELALPLEAIRPLLGIRKNTLDIDHSYIGEDELRVRAVLPEVGRKYEMYSRLRKKKTGSKNSRALKISQRELDVPEAQRPRDMVEASWLVEADKKQPSSSRAVLKSLKLLSHNLLTTDYRQVIGGIGVINRMHTDMLKLRDYPRLLDHLTEYGHLDLVRSSSRQPPSEGRLVLTSVGGNNLREIYPGIGEDIGGNCKAVETEWMDRKTKSVRRVGVIFDLGAYIIRQKSEWTGGGPDIVEKLKYCKNIFISHHHLDHLDFIIPYIKRNLINKSHRLHMTPEVWEMAKDKLAKWGIKESDRRMPQINLLKDTGVIDIADDHGKLRMSVAYGVDAVPHSAKDTPFIAYGRNGKKIIGSYMYLGDMRYDEDWFVDHDSPFWDPVGLMLRHAPHLKDQKQNLIPTYTEQDGTSVKRTGLSPREREVEENLALLLEKCVQDKHVAMPVIGTNDGRRETGLRLANRTGRKITALGSAVEKIFRIANKLGVNPYRCPRPAAGSYTGIDDYLKWHANELGLERPTEYAGRTSQTVKNWFKHDKPGSILAFLSGSQGTEIEKDSVTYKLAEGTSYFDSDPETSSSALPADLKDWAIIVSQSAIPGNNGQQHKMILKLATRGAIVFEPTDDGVCIHNGLGLLPRFEREMQKIGRRCAIEGNKILIRNFPIHASGHGRNGDFRLWLKKLQAKYFGLHHTDDMESVIVAYDTIRDEGKEHPGRIYQNAEEVEIGNNFVRVIGRGHTSVVLTKETAEDGKHYNMRLEAERAVVIDDRSPYHDIGLRSTANGIYKTSFGVDDIEDIRARQKKSGERRPESRSDQCVAKPPREYVRPIFQTPPWAVLENV